MPDENEIRGVICERIRELVDGRGMTQAELARRSGLDKHAVYRVVSGRGVTFEQVWSIASGLNVSPLAFLPVEGVAALTPAETELVTAARAGDGPAVIAALRSMGVQLARENPDGALSPAALREVGSAASQAARAQQRLADVITQQLEADA